MPSSLAVGASTPTVTIEVPADLVGISDIAERLGVKPQTVAMWRYRGLLPEPRWTVSGLPVWQWGDIVAWHAARKATPRKVRSA